MPDRTPVSRGQFDTYVHDHDIDEDAHGALMNRHLRDNHVPLESRISLVEKFMWMLLGGMTLLAVVAGSNWVTIHVGH